MKIARAVATALLTLAGVARADGAGSQSLYVYSTINALLAGAYEGDQTVGSVRQHNDFAIGTFNGLDGELVAWDGVFFHVRADGSVKPASDDERIPLVYALPFKPTVSSELGADAAGSLKALEASLDKQLANPNAFWAVQIRGRLASVTTRAIPRQARPYVPLAEAAKHQATWTRTDLDGTLIGLRSPAFSAGISVPGWHWHFVSGDKSIGGHVLAGSLSSGVLRAQELTRMQLELPATSDFLAVDQRDRSSELKQVEGAR